MDENNNNDYIRLSKRQIIEIVIIVLILLFGIVSCTYFIASNNNQSSTSDVNLTDDDAGGFSIPKTDEEVASINNMPSPTFPMYDNRTVDANTKKVKLSFYNPEKNQGNYYIQYTMKIEKTGEVLYKSPLLEPGTAVEEVELTRPLNVGTYNMVLVGTPFKLEDKTKGLASYNSKFTLNAVE